MKTKLLLFMCGGFFLTQQVQAQGCPSNLFFSEYIEGTSFNKVVEIYNPLPYTVDLNDYVLELYTNGASPSAQFFLADTIAPNQKYVICHPSAAAPVLSIADTTSGVLNFNGDDAFLLKHEFTFDTLDIIGVVGVDPGTQWIVAGGGATANYTLIRNSNVSIGTTDWTLSSSSQWLVTMVDDFTNLQIHSFTAPTNEYFLQNFTICENDSVLVNGTYLKIAGTYYDTLSAVSGCDSIIVTDVNTNPTSLIAKDTSNCPGTPVFIGGAFQTTAGTYYDTIPSVITGCDSVIAWNYTLLTTDFITVNTSICEGDSIFLEGGWQKLDGVYTDVLTSFLTGCDSTVQTTLAVTSIDASFILSNSYDSLMANMSGANYQWLECPAYTAISGATDQEYQVIANGYYTVEVSLNGCVDTADCMLVLIENIEEYFQANLINIYPNPANDVLTIDMLESTEGMLYLHDVSGKIVATYVVTSALTQLDISDLTPGVYQLRFISDDRQESQIVIVE